MMTPSFEDEAMSKIVLLTDAGKKVVLSDSDECLYKSPRNPPNTGTSYTSGEDLLLHKSRSGNVYYYIFSWSMWQGSVESYRLITEDEARAFLIEKAGYTGWAALDQDDIERVEELFPGIFEEDA